MNIKEKLTAIRKSVISYFTQDVFSKKIKLSSLDCAEIVMALMPLTIFGALMFGFNALLILAVSVAISVGIELLWSSIFKKTQRFDYTSVIVGIVAGLTLSSGLNIFLVITLNIIIAFLRKTVFKNSGIRFTRALLLSRGILALLFWKSFSSYSVPLFGGGGRSPIESLFSDSFNAYSIKILFFGIRCGGIGEISALLILVGAVYLCLRRFINPIVPLSFIITSAVLSFIFKQNIGVSLLGGGILFAAFFMTLDYSYTSDIRIKKILYGIACGVITFALRFILKTEAVYFAVLIVDLLFIHITKKEIKRFIRFVKKPQFRKLLSKLKSAFSV